MRHRFLPPLVPLASLASLAASLACPTVALAQEEPAPAPASASAPAAEPPPRCALGRHTGLGPEDLEAIELLVCAEVERALPGGPYRVRATRLGTKIHLAVASATEQTDLVIGSVEEVPVAAARLVRALATHTRAADTQDVTNVVSGEVQKPLALPTRVYGGLGIAGLVAFGRGSAASGAIVVQGFATAGRWAFGIDGRLGGDEDTVFLASGSSGVRYYASLADTSPFLGGGISLLHTEVNNTAAGGFGVFTEAGLDVMRTRRTGGTAALRLDLPTYTLDGWVADPRPSSGGYGAPPTKSRTYVPILSVTFALRF